MSRYKKVLIAIDTSAEAGQVIDVAKDYLDGTNDYAVVSVILGVGALYPGVEPGPGLAQPLVAVDEHLVESSRQAVIERASSAELDGSKVKILRGHAADELCAYAHAEDFDLIVIGSHTRGPFRRMLGSTAAGVLHGEHCDVVLVRMKG